MLKAEAISGPSVSRIANALDAELIAAEARKGQRSAGATDLVFQGTDLVYKIPTPDNLTKARGLFARALTLDPDNAMALVQLAIAGLLESLSSSSGRREAVLGEAEANATRAVMLAPNYALAHLILGNVFLLTNRAMEGIAECEQSLALDRNLADAHASIGAAKMQLGRSEETEAHVLEAFRLSPRDIFAYRWMCTLGVAKLRIGADGDAVVWLRRSVEANRNFPPAHFYLAAALILTGAQEQAEPEVRAGLALDPTLTIGRIVSGLPSSDPTVLAYRERIREAMRLAGIPE
jgi:tetratricopeptide (TPR) repeat protein